MKIVMLLFFTAAIAIIAVGTANAQSAAKPKKVEYDAKLAKKLGADEHGMRSSGLRG